MKRTAQRVQHDHINPAPKGEILQEESFPARVMLGLSVSTVAGALLGLLAGVLLFKAGIVIPGWEVLFSVMDSTYHLFWLLIGLVAGVLVGGVAVILATPDQG